MRVCILGKRSSIIGWVEGALAGWRAAGHTVMAAIHRDPRLHPGLQKALFAPALGAPAAAWLARRVRAFRPDLIVAIDAFSTPLALLDRLGASPGLPPVLGWVGDLFGDYARVWAPHFAAVAYTDSGLADLHRQMGLSGEAMYLPHAASAALATAEPGGARAARLVFVANPTPGRLDVLGRLAEPVVLHGPGWQAMQGRQHTVHLHRVGLAELGAIYRAHAAVLNMRNETHVLAGLNQRNFDPFLCGAAVATDPQPDLERCFDPGTEVLVWRSPEELDAMSARLRREPDWAEAVAMRGRQRILAEHTYAARLATLARWAGVGGR